MQQQQQPSVPSPRTPMRQHGPHPQHAAPMRPAGKRAGKRRSSSQQPMQPGGFGQQRQRENAQCALQSLRCLAGVPGFS